MSCAQVEAPYFTLALDTTPPRVSVAAQGIVAPPDTFSATLTTSEPYARLEAVFADALGDVTTYGVARTSPTTALLVMPTTGLAPGGGILTLTVADDVGNTAMVDWPLVIDAPRAYDVDVSMGPGYAVETTMTDAFAAEIDLGRAYAVQATPDEAHEVEVGMHPAYAIELEAVSA